MKLVFETPENIFEEQMNAFIEANKDYGDTIWFEFTN